MKKATQLLIVFMLVFSLLAGLPARTVQADGIVSYLADRTTVAGGERFTVSVNVDATPGLFGVQFSLTYDNTRLNVVEVRAGSAWPVGESFASSSFTSTGTATETIKFYATLIVPNKTVGAGTLATVLFEAKIPAATQVTSIANGLVLPLVFSDKNGSPITTTPLPSLLAITINPPASINGTVTLQAAASRPVTVNAVNLSTQSSANTTSGVAFSLAVPAATDYTLTATAPCHLSARRINTTSPGTGYNTTLVAGDVNGDNTINILDLSAIGAKFGQTDAGCANINGDGGNLVNILDLSLVASNFGKSGPTTW